MFHLFVKFLRCIMTLSSSFVIRYGDVKTSGKQAAHHTQYNNQDHIEGYEAQQHHHRD